MRYVYLAARILFGCVFVVASLDKIVHPAAFAKILYNYQIVPEILVNITALFLPWLEMLGGLALIFGPLALGAAVLMNGLMLIFMAALAYNWHRGLDIACGCFTTAALKGDPAMRLLEDAGILLVGLLALYGMLGKKQPKPL